MLRRPTKFVMLRPQGRNPDWPMSGCMHIGAPRNRVAFRFHKAVAWSSSSTLRRDTSSSESQEHTQKQIMMASNSTCSLMKLPYELRLRIYEHFLLADSEITIADTRPKFSGKLEVQLLRTCRLIHDEAADVLYGSNVFETLLHERGRLAARHLNKWLATIHDKNVARLNRLKCLLIFSIPVRKGTGWNHQGYSTWYNYELFHVEVAFKLRKNPSWHYAAQYQELAFDRSTDTPAPCSVEIPLAVDPHVEEQLATRFRTKQLSRTSWSAQDINFIYAAVSEIQPQPREDVDVAQLPESVVALFGRQSKASKQESWSQAVHGYRNGGQGLCNQILP